MRKNTTQFFKTFMDIYAQVVIYFLVRGVKLPGWQKLHAQQPSFTKNQIDRQLLLRDIKKQRFSVQTGPIWMRRTGDYFLRNFGRYKVLFSLFLKLSIAILFICLPIILFFIIRGTLPVPSRVPARKTNINLTKQTNYRTDWVYTEAPFTQEQNSPNKKFNYLPSGTKRGVNVIPVLEEAAPAGLFHIGIGSYPRRVQLVRGFLASNKSPAKIYRQRDVKIDIARRNRLRAQFYLLPNPKEVATCRIELRDEEGKLLLSSEAQTPALHNFAPTGLWAQFIQKFTPNYVPQVGGIREFTLDTDVPPKELNLRVLKLAEERSVEESTSATSESISSWPLDKWNQAAGNNLAKDDCVYLLGDLSYEFDQVKPLARRGIIFIVNDTFNKEVADDKTLMPAFNHFIDTQSIRFNQHRAQGNMTSPSMASLFTSLYPRQIGRAAFTYAADESVRKSFYEKNIVTMAEVLRRQGYRTAAMGNISLSSEALEGGTDFGFHDATVLESMQYETRHVTEEALNWLEVNGNSPFFLYLHYFTMHGPYRPPFSDLNVTRFLTNPFGLKAKRELYKGLARYWDREFSVLQKNLSDLGILKEVDVIITADHGAQMTERPFGYFSGIDSKVEGATTDKGQYLSDDEIAVPMSLKIGGSQLSGGKVIQTPTAHLDILPTISSLIQSKETHPWLGISLWDPSLAQGNTSTLEQSLSSREFIYSEGHRYTGMVLFGGEFKKQPIKYVRQLSRARSYVFRNKYPWAKRETWFTPETFTLIDLKNNKETWVPSVDNHTLGLARKSYYANSPLHRTLTFQASADLDLKLEVTGTQLELDIVPDEIQIELEENSNTFTLEGRLLKGQTVAFTAPTLEIQSIQSSNRIVMCAEAYLISRDDIANIVKDATCAFNKPHAVFVDKNFKEPVLTVTKGIAGDSAQTLGGGTGAGEALREALKDWGYAK